MSENSPRPNDDEQPKKFRIARKRLGTIRFIDPKGEYGFIEAEDFRDDVFFHHSVFEQSADASGGPLSVPASPPPGRYARGRDNRHTSEKNQKLVAEDLVQRHVEFELDDELFETEQKLRAKIVRPTRRPMGRKLSGRDATFNIVTHHPKARRKRPDWRN